MKLMLQRPTTRPMEEDRSVDTATPSELRWNRLMVAVDFTPECRAAMMHAAELARIHGARLILVHVVEPPSFMSGFEDVPICKTTEQVRAEAQARLENWVAGEVAPFMETEHVVRVGRPHREIARLAAERDADVIIMAEEPRNWLERLLLGSVTAKVKRRASCPVLTLAVPRRVRARNLAVKFAPEEAWRCPGAGRARLRPQASTT